MPPGAGATDGNGRVLLQNEGEPERFLKFEISSATHGVRVIASGAGETTIGASRFARVGWNRAGIRSAFRRPADITSFFEVFLRSSQQPQRFGG
jgi:hypothetical protein